jgi:hypothetical protein
MCKTLRTGILAGVSLSVLVMACSIYRYPSIMLGAGSWGIGVLFLMGLLWYSVAAIRWTRPKTDDDLMVLSRGAKWGIVIGLAWTVEVLGGNVFSPHQFGSTVGLFAAIVAAVLPVTAGAAGTESTGRISTGLRIGFWSGVVSGLMTFLVLAGVGYLVVYIPGFPGLETPKNAGAAITGKELAAYNVGDYLAGGISHLFLIGAIYCSAAGAFGSLLARIPCSFQPNKVQERERRA